MDPSMRDTSTIFPITIKYPVASTVSIPAGECRSSAIYQLNQILMAFSGGMRFQIKAKQIAHSLTRYSIFDGKTVGAFKML